MEKIDFIELDNIDSSNYTLTLPPNEPLILGENPEIGLKSYMLWYTFPNICEKYKNNKLKVKYDNAWKSITIPDGMWEVEALSDYVNKVTAGVDEAIRFQVDRSTFHCIVHLAAGVELDLTEGKLFEILGLEQKIYTESESQGLNFINITKSLDKVYIRCDLVDRKYQYELRDVLYSILPVANPGEALMSEVDHPLEYYRCKNRVIREINIRLTNQKGEPIFFNEKFYIKIAIRSHVKTE